MGYEEAKKELDSFYNSLDKNERKLFLDIFGTFKMYARTISFEEWKNFSENEAFLLSTIDFINKHPSRKEKPPISLDNLREIYDSMN